MSSLQEVKRILEDVSWDLLDKADDLVDTERPDAADYVREAESLVMDAIDCLREAARRS